MHSIALGLAFLYAVTENGAPASAYAISNATTQCRYLPGDSGWPSSSKWKRLNSTVGGRLLKAVPLAATCHDPFYDEEQCNILRQNWSLPLTYEENAFTPMSYWFQNSTCDPWSERSSPCELGNMAVYAINVSSAADVSAGLKFAQKHNIRLTIRNTGHDYAGKSSGQGSLALWTHNLNSISVKHNYSSPWYQGPAMKLGSGVRGGEAYQAANAAGLRVVGGDCPTVGLAGGFIQGGGHSSLSGAYGLGADNVLEWEVVLPNATLITATPERNVDIYWALAGGGGATFGVVISVTIRAHPDGPVGGASLTFSREGMDNDTFWEAYLAFQKFLPTLNAAGAQSAFAPLSTAFNLQGVTLPGHSEAEMRTLMSNFTQTLAGMGISYNLLVTSKPTFLEHFWTYFGPAPWGGYVVGELMTGRLIPLAVSEASPKALVDAFRDITDSTQIIIGSTAQDVSITHQRYPVANNSVLPGWRSSLHTLLIQSYFNSSIPWEEKQRLENQLIDFAQRRINRELPRNTGTYLNEASFSPKVDWKTQFYGSNYDRLLAIKHAYDPTHTLWAATAVASDEWMLHPDGHLCKI